MADFDSTAESAAIDGVATALYEIDGAIREARNLTYCGGCGKGFPNAHLDHKCLRDEFAMAALGEAGAFVRLALDAGIGEPTQDLQSHIAETAYRIADAMLEARKPRATDDKIAAALTDASLERMGAKK